MPKLRVVKGLRLDADTLKEAPLKVQRITAFHGAVYIKDDVVEPSSLEARALLEAYPEHFAEVK